LSSNPIDPSILETFEQRFKCLDKSGVFELDKELQTALYNIKEKLFMNKGLIFYDIDYFDQMFDTHIMTTFDDTTLENTYTFGDGICFGALFLIEDDFLTHSKIFYKWKE